MRLTMRPIYGTHAALLVGLIAASCATTEPPPTASAAPDVSTVYLYRPRSGIGGLGCPSHNLDSGEFKSLPYGGSIRFDVAPGAHTIGTSTSWCFIRPLELKVAAKPGEVTFVRFTYSD